MLHKFADDSRVPTRALQIYLVLIGLAWDQRTITYGDLSVEQMGGYGNGGILADPLGCIMDWCEDHDLPPLTVLVVNQTSGLPGAGLKTANLEEFGAELRRVYKENWFLLVPPTVAELASYGAR